MKPLKLVVVEWLDAWVRADEPVTLADVGASHHPEPVTTIGWVLLQDDTGISLANEVYDGHYRGRTFVPAGMIESITPYKLTKARQPKTKPAAPSPPTAAADT